jgi:hypothetical protein
MTRKRVSVDIEDLLIQLLSAWPIPEEDLANKINVRGVVDMRSDPHALNVEQSDRFPLISLEPAKGSGRLINNAHYSSGDAWAWIVNFTIFDTDRERCSEVADWLYEALHMFEEEEHGSIAGIGNVSQTEDNGSPARTGVAKLTSELELTQYDGSFAFIVTMRHDN